MIAVFGMSYFIEMHVVQVPLTATQAGGKLIIAIHFVIG